LPGASKEIDRDLAETCLGRCGWKNRLRFTIVDDTWAGTIAGTLSGFGICAFAGTGASVYVGSGAFPIDRSRKFDGWGPILGDFGSGFQLVVDLFRMIARRADEGVVLPIFSELLERHPEIGDLADLQQWFDGLFIVYPYEWRTRFAEVAAIVTQAADRTPPDPDAQLLVMRAAKEMATTITTAIRDAGREATNLPVICQGGMFEHSRLYRVTVAKAVRVLYPNPIRLAPFRTVIGASLIAAGGHALVPPRPMLTSILESIKARPPKEQAELTYQPWDFDETTD
jgi:N-acetylglucosamine kinase-like BadF-type ATPase